MKNKLHLITLTALAVAFAGPFSAQAKSKKALAGASPAASVAAESASSPAGKKMRAIPYYGKVANVTAGAKTFSIMSKEGKERVFTVTDQSVLTKAGQPATFAEIVKDEEVRGSYWSKGTTMEAKSVKLGPLTAEEEAAKAAKAAKRAAKKAAAGAPMASPSAAH